MIIRLCAGNVGDGKLPALKEKGSYFLEFGFASVAGKRKTSPGLEKKDMPNLSEM